MIRPPRLAPAHSRLVLALLLGLLAAPPTSAQAGARPVAETRIELAGGPGGGAGGGPGGGQGRLWVRLELEGAPVVLDLRPASVRSAEFRLLVAGADGRLTEREPEPTSTWRGVVRGRPGWTACASVTPGPVPELRGAVSGDGELWFVEPLVDAAGALADPRELGRHAVRRGLPALPGACLAGLLERPAGSGSCVPDDATAEPEALSGPACVAVAELAVDADHEYYLANGASVPATQASIEAVLLVVNEIYLRDLAVRHELSTLVVRSDPADPYANDEAGPLLEDFRAHWNADQAGVTRDVAHLVTGREVVGNIIGLAWVGVVCSSSYGYAWSQFTFSFDTHVSIMAHELGHNWGAPHCSSSGCFLMCGGCHQLGPDSTDLILDRNETVTCLDAGGPEPAPVGPNARRDRARSAGGAPVLVDVLANDTDANCDELVIDFHAAFSEAGGVVQRSVGTGFGGRDELRYTPPDGFEGLDRFTYTIRDAAIQDSGEVVVVVTNDRPDLVLHLLLDEAGAATTAVDASPRGLDGSYENGPLLGEPGADPATGTSVRFDGVDDLVRVPGGPGLQHLDRALSISVRVRPGAQDGWRRVISHPRAVQLGFLDGNPVFTTPGILDYFASSTVPAGSWTHLGVVFEDGNVTFYVDGAPSGPLAGFSNAALATGHWFVGSRNGSDQYFDGWIDDLQVYDDALTAAQMEVLRTSPGAVLDLEPDSYCAAAPNSSGEAATMGWSGSVGVAANDLVLTVFGLPPGPLHTGIFAASPDAAELPLGDGVLCLGSETLGFIVRVFPSFVSSASGTAAVALDHARPPFPEARVEPGATWHYQAWFRDFVPGGSGFNLSDGLRVVYAP